MDNKKKLLKKEKLMSDVLLFILMSVPVLFLLDIAVRKDQADTQDKTKVIEQIVKRTSNEIGLTKNKDANSQIEALRSIFFTILLRDNLLRETPLYNELKASNLKLKALFENYSKLKRENNHTAVRHLEDAIEDLYSIEGKHIAILHEVTSMESFYKFEKLQDKVILYLKIFNGKLDAIIAGRSPVENLYSTDSEVLLDVITGTTENLRSRSTSEVLDNLIQQFIKKDVLDIQEIKIASIDGSELVYSGKLTPITGTYYSITDENGVTKGINACDILTVKFK